MYEASGQWSTTQSLSPQPLTDWWERRGSRGRRGGGARGLHTNHSQINSPLPQSTILPPFSLPHLFVFFLSFISVCLSPREHMLLLPHPLSLSSLTILHLLQPPLFPLVIWYCASSPRFTPAQMPWEKKHPNSFKTSVQSISMVKKQKSNLFYPARSKK